MFEYQVQISVSSLMKLMDKEINGNCKGNLKTMFDS